MEKHKKNVRDRNKIRYHSDEKYKKHQNLKSNIHNKAIKDLINNHRKEFEELIRKWKIKIHLNN